VPILMLSGLASAPAHAVAEHEPHLVGVSVALAPDGHTQPLVVGHDVAAQALGLTIPEHVLLQATEVIQ